MKALIIGTGKSGKSAAKFLKKRGYSVYLVSDEQKGAEKVYSNEKFLKTLSLIVVSPGINSFHVIYGVAKKYGISLISEFELGVSALQGKTVMITGTNGKTTSSALTAHILGEKKATIGGNIGIPVTSYADKTTSEMVNVLEVSSFMLEQGKHIHPNISVLLNIAPDHISYHGSYKKYKQAKLKIFVHQTKNDYAIINFDDKETMDALKTKKLKANVFYFSLKNKVKGCYVENDSIYFNDGNSSIKVAEISDIKIPGLHNLENALASALICLLLGENVESIKRGLQTFNGLSHRLEWVTDIAGVSFVNDSKATNPASTIVAMQSISGNLTVILGGSKKGLSYDDIFLHAPENVKNFICMGENKKEILAAARKYLVKNVYEVNTLKEAVDLGFNLSCNLGVVLLSPASASFDMFSSYEERGRVFMKLVREKARREDKKCRGKNI